jgi:hypothetical protein
MHGVKSLSSWLSSRHSKVRLSPGVALSLPAKRKLAESLSVSGAGPAAMRVSGGIDSDSVPSSTTVRSTSQSYVAGVGSTLSAWSVARTSKWCGPCSSPWRWNGGMHSSQLPGSGGESMSGGSFGWGGSRSGSTGSGSGSGGGSRRHS